MLAVALFAVSIIIKKLRQSLILPTALCAVILGCLLFSFFQTAYDDVVSLVGENVSVTGTVAERPTFSRENCRYYCIVKVDKIGKDTAKTKLRLSFSESRDGIDPNALEIGDKIKFTGTVYKIASQTVSSRRHYKSQSVYLGAYSVQNTETIKPAHRPLGYYIDLLRQKVTQKLMHDFDNDNASLLVALLTGDKSYMEDDLYGDFKKSGVVHIMAVSGLHLSIWVAFLSLFMDFTGKKGKILAVIMIVFTVFMMNFACFTGSVKRASTMTILYFIGKIFGKKTDALNSLGFACICSLVFNPFGVFDISFLLSFLSTLGIILLGVPMSDKLLSKLNFPSEKVKNISALFVSAVALSVSATVFTLPVSVFVLGGVSLVSPLTNLLCFITVSPLLLLTGFYSFLRLVPFVSPIMGVLMKGLSSYIICIVKIMSEIPFSYVNTDFENLGLWFVIALLFLFLTALFYKYSHILMKVSAIISLGVFLLSFSMNFYTSLDKCIVTVYSENNGSCAVVSLNGKGVLVGFEGNYYDKDNIINDSENNKVKIEAAIFADTFVDKEKELLCSELGTENILTGDGECVVLFDKVKIIKSGKNITIDASKIKTEIFYKEYLQDQDKYDTIYRNDGKFVFSFRENDTYTITVLIQGGEEFG